MARLASAVEREADSAVRRTISPEANKLSNDDRAAHDWYRFVLSYPPHLVRDYLSRFRASPEKRVLDPFCGTGTTIVECKKLGNPERRSLKLTRWHTSPRPFDFDSSR
ncbi:MAG: hypothetical protein DMF42_02620 [Verrucomicrobia bacterium]|nr:MAG: hypothetical protein DMF42_02620 [Verrucomicrobiota bacterium]